jgi:hypothetical protein
MLISESKNNFLSFDIFLVSKEHKEEMDKIEHEFLSKLEEKEDAENTLKNNIEFLQKYVEELEGERETNRQNKKRLELEMTQNLKSHEEEVQLRLKFESKLNSIHSVYRDLQSKVRFEFKFFLTILVQTCS